MTTLTVFVSSTFRDFNAERDELAGPIRNEINLLVRPLGLSVEFIDLRWGVDTAAISDEEAERLVLTTCAQEIERAALFVGLVGPRAGWSPSRDALPGALSTLCAPVDRVDELRRRLFVDQPCSVTDFEFWLARQLKEAHQVVVLARADRAAPPLPGRVGDEPSFTFVAIDADAPADFRSTVLCALLPAIERESRRFQQDDESPHQRAADLHWSQMNKVFVGRDDLVRQICDHVQAGRRVVLHGAPGVGVSAVWIHAVAALRQEGALWAAVAGLTPDTTDPEGMAQQVLDEVGLDRGDDTAAVAVVRAARNHGSLTVAIDGADMLRTSDGCDRLMTARRLMDSTQVVTLMSTHDASELSRASRFDQVAVEVTPLDTAAVAQAITASLYPRELPAEAIAAVASAPRRALWVQLAAAMLNQIDARSLAPAQFAENPALAIREAVIARARELPGDMTELIAAFLAATVDATVRRNPAVAAADVRRLMLALAISPDGLSPADLRELDLTPPAVVTSLVAALDPFLMHVDDEGSVRFRSAAVRATIADASSEEIGPVHDLLTDFIRRLPSTSSRHRWLQHHALRARRGDVVDELLSVGPAIDDDRMRWISGQFLDPDVPVELLDQLGLHGGTADQVLGLLCAGYWADLRYRTRGSHSAAIDAIVRSIRRLAVATAAGTPAYAEAYVLDMDWAARSQRWEDVERLLADAATIGALLAQHRLANVMQNRVHQCRTRLWSHDGRYTKTLMSQLVQNRNDRFSGSDPDLDPSVVPDILESHVALATMMEEAGTPELALDSAKSAIRLGGRLNQDLLERHPTLAISLAEAAHVVGRTVMFQRRKPGDACDLLIDLEPTVRDHILFALPSNPAALRLQAEHRYLLGRVLLATGDAREGWQRIGQALVDAHEAASADPSSDAAKVQVVRATLASSELFRVATADPWLPWVVKAVAAQAEITPQSVPRLTAWTLINARIVDAMMRARPGDFSTRKWRKMVTPGQISASRARLDGLVHGDVFDLDRIWVTLGPAPTPPGPRSTRFEDNARAQLAIGASMRGLTP